MFFENTSNTPNQFVTQINGFSITIKREDLDNYIRVLEKIKHNKLDKIKR
mgnify:CR=1 FL=1